MSRRRNVGTPLLLFVVAALSFALPATSTAQEAKEVPSPGVIHDRFILSFGFFLPDYNTDARISSPDHEGTGVDLEKDLGFKADDSVFRFDGIFRISKRHQIGVSWFSLNRSTTKTIEKEISWDDYTFDVGVNIRGRFDMDLYKVRYRYMVIQRPRVELGIGGGMSYMAFDFGLAGKAWISEGDELESVEADWNKKPGFPVPSIGADIRWAILGNLFLSGDISYIRGSYDDQEARYSDMIAAINWFPWRNVGFGLMYNWVKIMYQDRGKYFTGRIDYRYAGPVVALNLIF